MINELLIYTIIFIVITTILQKVVVPRVKGLDVGTFSIMYRTTRFNNWITRIGSKRTELWKKYWTLGIPLSIFLMIGAYWLLFSNFVGLILGSPEAGPVAPLLPGITIKLTTLPYMLTALLVVMVTHEASHGISAVSEKLGIQSAGVLLLLLLPGAFVELDEKKVMKAKISSRLRIFCAGSYTNFMVAILALILMISSSFTAPFLFGSSNGLLVTDVVEGSPSYGQIPLFSVIHNINGNVILNHQDLRIFLGNITPGSTLVVNVSGNIVNIIAGENPNNSSVAYMGIVTLQNLESRHIFWFLDPVFSYFIANSLFWTFFLSFNIALFNMLAIPGFDGDRTLQDLIEMVNMKNKKRKKKIKKYTVWALRLFALFLLFGNIGITLIKFGTLPVI